MGHRREGDGHGGAMNAKDRDRAKERERLKERCASFAPIFSPAKSILLFFPFCASVEQQSMLIGSVFQSAGRK